MSNLVSIIIVNWNGKEFLSACLNSLFKITYPNFEIIVVDNGSTDGSVEFIKKFIEGYSCKFVSGTKKPSKEKKSRVPPVRDNSRDRTIKLIENRTNLGFAEGNNIGVKETAGKYVLLLNNDTEVTRDFLEGMVRFMENNENVAVIQPKIIFEDNKLLQAGGSFFTRSGFLYHYGYMQNPDEPKFNRVMNIFSANGACMLVRKKIADKIGLFDPDFFAYFEESDFCWRTLLAGHKIVYLPNSTIFHRGGQSASKLNPGLAQYYSFRNRFCSFIKNLSFLEMLKILPVHLVVCIFCLFYFIIMGRIDCAVAVIGAFWWNLVNLRKTLVKRKTVQCIRRISDKELMSLYRRKRDLRNYFLFFYKRKKL